MASIRLMLYLVVCTLFAGRANAATLSAPTPADLDGSDESLGDPLPVRRLPPTGAHPAQLNQGARSQADTKSARNLLLRALDPIDENSANQPTSKEYMRRLTLDQLLDALSPSIPTSTSVPIYRKGRTYPSVGNAEFRGPQLVDLSSSELGDNQIGSPGARLQIWAPSLVSGRLEQTKSRKSPLSSIVWERVSDKTVGPGTTPPYYTAPTVASRQPTGLSTTGLRFQQRSGPDAAAEPTVSLASLPLTSSYGFDHGANKEHVQRVYHRSGTEEIAPQTVQIHSRSPSSDFEFKRVENSRSWNNLRGMWGKRAISEKNLGDRFQELLE